MKAFYSILSVLVILVSCKPEKDQKARQSTTRPNIIFIMSDDHAYQAISAYGSQLIQTPNIDRIAKDGMLFTNACVTNSICAPSRATILTGKHTHLNGKIDNHFPFDTTQVTFPQIFQENGYKTSMFGKLHFGNNPKGVDEFMILPGQGHYINPDFITTSGEVKNIEGYVTDIITDLSIDWLEREANSDEPFMMMYLHKAPHRPWWPSPEKFAEFTQKTFPEPSTLFDDYDNRGTAAKTAEMNLLNHMMYSHDSKIRPETLEAMGEVSPAVEEYPNGFYGPYNRANEGQKALYDPILDSINEDFRARWPEMNDTEKMRWKYQRYMQDYLATISS
ncbi:MAG: sulfatase-like hydrolase/transferase, partial [Cyclobacteriaceae bacterium]